jgi:hypothetical protein
MIPSGLRCVLFNVLQITTAADLITVLGRLCLLEVGVPVGNVSFRRLTHLCSVFESAVNAVYWFRKSKRQIRFKVGC